jgi:hypothetical protein
MKFLGIKLCFRSVTMYFVNFCFCFRSVLSKVDQKILVSFRLIQILKFETWQLQKLKNSITQLLSYELGIFGVLEVVKGAFGEK